jgi:hypothetical protein
METGGTGSGAEDKITSGESLWCALREGYINLDSVSGSTASVSTAFSRKLHHAKVNQQAHS